MSAIQLFLLIWLYGMGFNTPHQSKAKAECLDCHKALTAQTVVHPVAESCDNCHVSNGNEHPQTGTKGFALTEAVPGMCYVCHDAVMADIQKSKDVHGAIYGKKSCTACHSPHSSAQPKLLISEEKELCFSCHNKTIVTDSNRTENIKLVLDKSQYIHGAIDGGGCIACHNPHASTKHSLLKDAFPERIYAEGKPDNYALCFTCHDNLMISPDTATSATQFRNGNKNLHYLHINGTKGLSCSVCHNVHASANQHLINEIVNFGKWEMPMRYKAIDGGGSCYPGCHAEKNYIR